MSLIRPPVETVWASSGDKVTPTSTELEAGWPPSPIPPSRQRFNWVLNRLHGGLRYLTRRGLPDWNSGEPYEPDDRCLAPDGKTYRAKVANTNKTPATNPTEWERWGYSESEIFSILRSGLLSPTTCPATGPAAAPNSTSPWTVWKSVAPHGEYWMWLGDAWQVVAAYATLKTTSNVSRNLADNVNILIHTLTAHRTGTVSISAFTQSRTPSGSSTIQYNNSFGLNGVLASISIDTDYGTQPALNAVCLTTTAEVISVAAGDTISLWTSIDNNASLTSTMEKSTLSIEYTK